MSAPSVAARLTLPATTLAGEGGVIYLIHLDRGLRVRDGQRGPVLATHYTGWTLTLASRIEEHESGRGSAFMAEVARRGIAWKVVRCWSGSRRDERQIKRQRNAPEFCPCCEELGRNRRPLRQAVGLVETFRLAPGPLSFEPETAGRS